MNLVKHVVLLTVTVLATSSRAGSQVQSSPAPQGGPELRELPPLPFIARPADSAETILAAYHFAAEHPEVVRFLPCFCSCGKYYGHRSSEDCYISARGKNNTVVWNAHAEECPICLAVGRDARKMFLEGRDLTAIRQEIERTFAAKFSGRTDTPTPPAAKAKSQHPGQ